MRGAVATARCAGAQRHSVVILGAGPNRIGQGIEFDYCCVHAAMCVRESGRDAVMINCNPETVSTDYDTSDRLYFEPLTLEDVLGVVEQERPEGVIVQFGGQTPLKLAAGLAEAGRARCWAPRWTPSTWPRTAARFGDLLGRLGLSAPAYATAHSVDDALAAVGLGRIPAAGASLLRARRPGDGDRLRPFAVCDDYLERVGAGDGRATYLDRFLENAIEVDVDAICDGRRGVDRRRSCSTSRRRASTPATRPACCRPTRWAERRCTAIREQTEAIALGLGVVGLMNVQFAVTRRRGVRDRGQPAGLAHGAVRVQGHRHPAGQGGLPGDARRPAGAAGPARRPRAGPRVGQGGGAARSTAFTAPIPDGARDALHRRGDGRGRATSPPPSPRPRRRPAPCCRPPARCSSPSPTPTSRPRR